MFATFGPLPAGTYTYLVYHQVESDPPTLVSTQTIVVSAFVPPVPTASEWALTALAVLLAGAGILGIRAR